MVAALFVAVAAATATIGPAGFADAAANGPCPGTDGVTVVVDATRLGGGVRIGCAPGSPTDGLVALRAAGFAVRSTARFPGFVCRVDGAPASDPCLDTPPADAYWAYWHAPRGGSWTYSDTGAADRRPPVGSVEGWVFSDETGAPPSSPPPAAPARPAPPPAPSPAPAAPPGAVVAGVTQSAPAPAAAAGDPASDAGWTPGSPGTGALGGADGTVGPAITDQPALPGPGGEPPVADAASGISSGPDTTVPDDARPGSATVADGTEELAVAVQPVEESGGTPWTTVAALALVGAVAALGVAAARRRRNAAAPW